jgi:hypothetical protein
MTRSFTALAVLSLVLAIGPSSAAGVNVPAQYRGLWCFNKKATQLSCCREANDESYQYIGRNSMKMSGKANAPLPLSRQLPTVTEFVCTALRV